MSTLLATIVDDRAGLPLLRREEIARRLRDADQELLRRAIRRSLRIALSWEISQRGTIRLLRVESGRLRADRLVTEEQAQGFIGGWPALREVVLGEVIDLFAAEALAAERRAEPPAAPSPPPRPPGKGACP